MNKGAARRSGKAEKRTEKRAKATENKAIKRKTQIVENFFKNKLKTPEKTAFCPRFLVIFNENTTAFWKHLEAKPPKLTKK